MSNKKSNYFKLGEGEFAENNANISSYERENDKKTQNEAKNLSNDRAIDKKLVKSIIKDEKRQLKDAKKQEKAKRKEEEKAQKQKINELLKEKRLKDKQVRRYQEETIRELEKRGKFASWFRLDNAASIYPSASTKDWNFVVRVSATLKDKVNPEELQNAVDDIMPRFPSFNVRLCHGFFWNYYERNFSRLIVEKETGFPCSPFNLNDPESFLIRVLYRENTISFEFFHAVTDGRGALLFLNSLLARYFERLGVKIKEYTNCFNYLDFPLQEEVEDSFHENYTGEKIKRPKERAAYKIKGNLLPSGVVNTLEAELSVSKLKEVAKNYNASVTEFLTAVVAFVINKKRKNAKKPTRISVPIDLRERFSSKTMRNFSSYINVEVDGDNLSFENVIEIVKNSFKNIDNRFLQANINANVRIQKNFFVKILPLFLKNIILKSCFNYLGENYQTLSLSNLGAIKAPEEFNGRVLNYSMNLGRSLHNEKSIGIASFGDRLNICISSKLYETETERDIFTFLASLGLEVEVFSNRRDLYGTR